MKLFKASPSQAPVALLVQRIQSGESAAEDELVERFRRGVVAVIRNNGGHPAAEDLSQEVFYIVLRKIREKELREPEKLSEFISGVARNLALRHAKKSRSFVEMDEEWEEIMVDPGPSPYSQLLQKEEMAAVQRTLAQLPHERDREILRRFYCDKEDKETICADLKLTSQQFNQILSRARKRFQERYRK